MVRALLGEVFGIVKNRMEITGGRGHQNKTMRFTSTHLVTVQETLTGLLDWTHW